MNISNREVKLEALNEVYREIAELIGIEKTLKLYRNYKGLQVNFPTRLYDKEYVIDQVIKAKEAGENIRVLAVKYNYSERWIREMIQERENQEIKDKDKK